MCITALSYYCLITLHLNTLYIFSSCSIQMTFSIYYVYCDLISSKILEGIWLEGIQWLYEWFVAQSGIFSSIFRTKITTFRLLLLTLISLLAFICCYFLSDCIFEKRYIINYFFDDCRSRALEKTLLQLAGR